MKLILTDSFRGRWSAVCLLLACLPPLRAQSITQAEPDDSIPTANATGLVAGASGLIVTSGDSGDGEHGRAGDGTGDFDFFKLTAAPGQKIYINANNRTSNGDFDSAIGLYYYSGGVATMVAENDDESVTPANPRGYDRTSLLSYTVPAGNGGEYYVCMSNWINGPSNLPSDPLTPGTSPGLAGGTPGLYQLFIGLDLAAPVPDFTGGVVGYPVPAFVPTKIPSTPRYSGTLTVRNAGTVNWTITAANLTGAGAGQFSLQGLTLPATILPNQFLNITINFDSQNSAATASATLDFTSNDPLDLSYQLTARGSPVTGRGVFAIRQVFGVGGVANLSACDEVLAGNGAGAEANVNAAVVNYATGNQGNFTPDPPFPLTGDNFTLQATGPIFVRTAGTYTFVANSDDGQRLRIDGTDVILDDAAHGPTSKYGSIDLTAGVHQVEYTMFDSGGGDAAEVGISQQPGDFTAFEQSTWELLEAYSPDTDGDGLPNQWEDENGTNPNVADANGDPDADGLTNAQEYGAGTKPLVADTDGDGLRDGVENNTGTWVSATQTGTNPLVADSDHDGMPDQLENRDLPFTGAAQPGSDPNKADTDGDGVADLGEVTLGTNPASAASTPALSYHTVLAEDFDSAGTSSTFAFLSSGGGFTPGVYDSTNASHGNAAQLIDVSQSNNNSIAWDFVPAAASSVRLTFDFSLSVNNGSEAADGLGIGLFRTSVYGTTGESNPAAGKTWENPPANGGLSDSLTLGLTIYGADTIRLGGPVNPTIPLLQAGAPFTLNNGLFNRVILTVITNGSGGSMVNLNIIEDIDGAATARSIAKNVLVPGFDVRNEDVRLIAGGRTGAAFSVGQIDNIKLESTRATAPPAGFAIIAVSLETGAAPAFHLTWSSEPGRSYFLERSTTLGTTSWTALPGSIASGGATTSATDPVPPGSPLARFYRVRLAP